MPLEDSGAGGAGGSGGSGGIGPSTLVGSALRLSHGYGTLSRGCLGNR
jgi:hypothetical protein